jgi:4a-hydroxytetrahydrobiopterin dehydratase
LDPTGTKLRRFLVAKNFLSASKFLSLVADAAESLGHHPDFQLTAYRNVTIDVYTHSVGGVTEFDFALASTIDKIPIEYSPKFLKDQSIRLDSSD